MTLDVLVLPTSVAAQAVEEVAAEYLPTALYAHSVRSYLWAVAHAQREQMTFDHDLLYVAALLHDIALTPPFDNHELPFEVASAHAAWLFSAGMGWPSGRRHHLRLVIEKHMWASVDPLLDPEGYLLEAGTRTDVTGDNVHQVPVATQLKVLGRWCRDGFVADFAQRLTGQAARKPATRAADLVRANLIVQLDKNPLSSLPLSCGRRDPTGTLG
jgi:hypothetical protein